MATSSQPTTSSETPSTTPRIPMSTRIKAWQDSDINPQLSSPLFRLPRELRQPIFELALAETIIPHPLALSHDFDIQRGHPPISQADLDQAANKPTLVNSIPHPPHRSLATFEDGLDWFRPDDAGPVMIYCALLRTSRRIYLETAHLPALQTELAIYYDSDEKLSPPWETSFDRTRAEFASGFTGYRRQLVVQALDYGRKIPYHALSRIRRLRLYGHSPSLHHTLVMQMRESLIWKTELLQREPGLLSSSLPPLRLFDQISTLHFTVRHLDWHRAFVDMPLNINPFTDFPLTMSSTGSKELIAKAARRVLDRLIGDSGREAAQQDSPLSPELSSQPHPHMQMTHKPVPRSLAGALALLPSLRDLTIDFEAIEDRRAEAERIVRWAVAAWRFLVFGNTLRVKVPPASRLPTGEPWALGGNALVRLIWEFDDWEKVNGIDGTHIWDIPPDAPTHDGRPLTRHWLVPREHIQRWSWRGLPWQFLKYCPLCRKDVGEEEDDGPAQSETCEHCAERKRLTAKGVGPRLYVWRVRWTAEEDVDFNRRAAEAHMAKVRSEPEPEPESREIPSWAGSDKEEMERRAALQICL